MFALSVLFLCINIFLHISSSNSQMSSTSSSPPPVQTGTCLPLNAFSWSSPAPDIVGVATVNNTAGTLFGRNCGPGNHIAARATTVERAVLMQPVDEVVVLLGGEVPAASMMQRCGLTLVPYLVIRCSSVPKVGTVPLIDLHFTLNISLTGILLPAHIWAKKSSR